MQPDPGCEKLDEVAVGVQGAGIPPDPKAETITMGWTGMLFIRLKKEIHSQFLFPSSWFQWCNNPESTLLLSHNKQQGETKSDIFFINQ